MFGADWWVWMLVGVAVGVFVWPYVKDMLKFK
jgi:hypothetical protein